MTEVSGISSPTKVGFAVACFRANPPPYDPEFEAALEEGDL